MTATPAEQSTPATRARDLRGLIRQLRRDYQRWARLCYRILDKTGTVVPLRLNPVQKRLGEIEAEELRTKGRARLFVLKGRQAGITTDQQARNLHLCWKRGGAAAMTLASTREETDKVFKITGRAIENYPEALLPRLGLAHAREVTFPGRDSYFATGTAGAKRTGRGVTLHRLHGSEFAFWDEPRSVLNTVEPAMIPEGSVIVLETTASGYNSEAHKFWKEAEKGENSYRTVFFPWWECDPKYYRTPLEYDDELGELTEEEAALVEHKGLDLEQIKWRREKIRDMGEAKFLQEYAEDSESCWLAAGGTFYDVKVLKALSIIAPKPRKVDLGGSLKMFHLVPEGERVIIGCDTAEGGTSDELDDSAWIARSFPSWKLIAEFADKAIEPDPLADLLDLWGRKLGGPTGPAFLVIEKNAHGITVLRRLRDVKRYPLDRLYRRTLLDTPKGQQDKMDRIGWHTSAESKPLMLDAGRQIFNAAKEGKVSPPSAGVIADAFAVRREGSTGTIKLNGRDRLVAEMLCWLGRSQIPGPWKFR